LREAAFTAAGEHESRLQPSIEAANHKAIKESKMNNEDELIYKVVVNHEEQYSIWPVDRENPRGWEDAGKSGSKAECLAYIKEVWTDMRPLSLRRKMEETAPDK
jgi:MbtH protein